MPILKLPYLYMVDVLPSSRHRNADRERIRDYAHVMIEEVGRVDMELAIVVAEDGGCGSDPFRGEPYYQRGELLFRRARNRHTGAPFDAASFEEAVSPRYDLRTSWPYLQDGDDIPFHRTSYPGPHCRWDSDHPDPLWTWEEGKLADANGWKPTRRFTTSTRERALGTAHEFLAKAIVVVEGEVFVACPEPVWAVDEVGDDRGSLRLDRLPTKRMAVGEFNLDRLDDAREWCRARGAREEPRPSVDVLIPDAVRRDDEWELANRVLDLQPRLPSGYRYGDPDIWAPVRSACEAIDAGDGRLVRERYLEVLDAVVEVVSSNGGLGGGAYGSAQDEAVLIAERWLMAARSQGHAALDDDDMAALSLG